MVRSWSFRAAPNNEPPTITREQIPTPTDPQSEEELMSDLRCLRRLPAS